MLAPLMGRLDALEEQLASSEVTALADGVIPAIARRTVLLPSVAEEEGVGVEAVIALANVGDSLREVRARESCFQFAIFETCVKVVLAPYRSMVC